MQQCHNSKRVIVAPLKGFWIRSRDQLKGCQYILHAVIDTAHDLLKGTLHMRRHLGDNVKS